MLLRKLVNVQHVGADYPQWEADCPLCDEDRYERKLVLSYKPKRDAAFASDVTVLIWCHACGNTHPRSYAEALCEHFGITMSQVMEGNEWYLDFAVGSEPWKGAPGREREPSPLPDEDEPIQWCKNLLEEPEFSDALAFLTDERGFTKETIALRGFGYRLTMFGHPGVPEPCFTIPVFDANRNLVDLRQRAWPGKKQYRGLKGHESHLYPMPMFGTSRWITEGEWDAALMRQHGFWAVTSTAGTKFKDEWIERFNPRVAVTICFDPEGYETACKLAERFHVAGRPNVFALDLGRAGLGPKEDLTDWFVKYGRSAGDLRRFLESERKRLRGARKAGR